jgi:hypothetical protein
MTTITIKSISTRFGTTAWVVTWGPGSTQTATALSWAEAEALAGTLARMPNDADPGEQAEPHPQLARLERVAAQLPPVPTCRCCGRDLTGYAALQAIQDGAGIHTRCITRHWGRHAHGKGISRCREFSTT